MELEHSIQYGIHASRFEFRFEFRATVPRDTVQAYLAWVEYKS
jgi:hypothetical protein